MSPPYDPPLPALADTTSLGQAPRAVTFDATGTLFGVPRLAAIYREVLARHGIAAQEENLAGLLPLVWRELACSAEPSRDRFASHPGGPRGWWAWYLERLCQHLEAPAPSRFAAAELYARFGRGEAYQVYPEVVSVLAELERLGLDMVVISNWDPRLPKVLDELDLGHFFSAVVCSAEVGVEKPHPAIFEDALARLGLRPEEVLHVGDRVREDVEGALALGMEALWVARSRSRGPGGEERGAGGGRRDRREDGSVKSLAGLPDLVRTARERRTGGLPEPAATVDAERRPFDDSDDRDLTR